MSVLELNVGGSVKISGKTSTDETEKIDLETTTWGEFLENRKVREVFVKEWNDLVMSDVNQYPRVFEILVENNSWNNSDIGYVYFLLNHKTGLMKIGSTKKISNRIKQIESSFRNTCGVTPDFELIGLIACKDQNKSKVESFVHNIFKKERVHGEWFKIDLELHVMDEIADVVGLWNTEVDIEGVPIRSEDGFVDVGTEIDIYKPLFLKDISRLSQFKNNSDRHGIFRHFFDKEVFLRENNRDLVDVLNQLSTLDRPYRKSLIDKIDIDDVCKAAKLCSQTVR